MNICPKLAITAISAAVLTACSTAPETAGADPAVHDGSSFPDAETRPAGEAQMLIVEGRISGGVECPIVTTAGGDVYSLSLGEADFGPGDYVRIEGELADASICMQGKGHLIPHRIDAMQAPAG